MSQQLGSQKERAIPFYDSCSHKTELQTGCKVWNGQIGNAIPVHLELRSDWQIQHVDDVLKHCSMIAQSNAILIITTSQISQISLEIIC